MVNNINTVEDFVRDLFNKGNYKEIIRLSRIIDINYILDKDVVRMMAVSAYKLNVFSLCIDLSKKYLYLKNDDHYIHEILAKSYLEQNEIEKAFSSYKDAIDLNNELILAKFMYLLLKYRIYSFLSLDEIIQIEKIALANKDLNKIRLVSYIQYSLGYFEQARVNLESILGKNYIAIDYLTLFDIVKTQGCNSKYFPLNKIDNEVLFSSNFEPKNHKNLFITLSPNNSFTLRKHDISYCDKLNLVDKTASYYILSIKSIASYIRSLVSKYNYSKVFLVGSSKGAVGVILLIDLLQKYCPNVQIKAVACSPQISLYPLNKNLIIPSYRKFSEYISCNKFLLREFMSLNFINEIKIKKNNRLTVFYGQKFRMDAFEADRINAQENLDIIPLNFSGHGSLIPLTIPEGKTKSDLYKKYKDLASDDDLAEVDGSRESTTDIVDEIYNIYLDPNMRLNKFLES
ncbi:tetratricopeptide repeat protein [Otariodibacter oris]|uniref:Uncharacterized protein n=1 Tax=Otariodibacter oris TaxID=1032623 RepID=A0A420XGK5_9PAST|nr:hypothetical protein [Otariodibacter oris]QGM80111.1 hypothetical protein A6A10_01130 [Otariodibacter oris]RKR71938.1 hypothetical protein DES31_1291 [Otariodibacter oris]